MCNCQLVYGQCVNNRFYCAYTAFPLYSFLGFLQHFFLKMKLHLLDAESTSSNLSSYGERRLFSKSASCLCSRDLFKVRFKYVRHWEALENASRTQVSIIVPFCHLVLSSPSLSLVQHPIQKAPSFSLLPALPPWWQAPITVPFLPLVVS